MDNRSSIDMEGKEAVFMTPEVHSNATPLEAANALARAWLILRRAEAERMGFRLEETARVVPIDEEDEAHA